MTDHAAESTRCADASKSAGQIDMARPACVPVAWHCPNDPDAATAFFWRRTGKGKCPNCSKALVPVYLGAAPAA